MIRVKSGIVGIRTANGLIRRKSAKDSPFSLSAKDEARLVNRGVAVYTEDDGVAEDEIPEDNDDEGAPDFSAMKFDYLKEIAVGTYGVDEEELKKAKSKVQVIALIEQAIADATPGGEPDGESGDSNSEEVEGGEPDGEDEGDDGEDEEDGESGDTDDGEPLPDLSAAGPVM